MKKLLTALLAGAALTMATTAPAVAKVKVACVGNSITYGATIPDRERDSYPSQLARMLGPDYEVGNFGRSGATLMKRGHHPYNATKECADAKNFAGDIAVIHLGVNDTDPRDWPDFSDDFVNDYVELIDSLRARNPKVRVIIANISPVRTTHYRWRSGTCEWRDSVRACVADVARLTGSELIDFNDPLLDRQQLMADGLHPDALGASLLARTVYRAITGNYGGLKLPQVWGDGMVIQRYRPVTVNGTADAGTTVTVTLGANKATAVTDNRGRWSVTLPPMKEATGLEMTVTDGHRRLAFSDVAVGEVWLASGQSNMEFATAHTKTFAADSAMMDDPMLRLFDMFPRAYTTPAQWPDSVKERIDSLDYYLPAHWAKSDVGSARRMSAVAWHFGRVLRDSLKVPVGIICNAIGGSGTEAWVDIEVMSREMPEVLVNWRRNDYIQKWVQQRAGENTGTDEASLAHRHPYEPTYLFATGIRPLAGFPIAGAIWYQGESNANNIEVHERLFPLVVKSFRRAFNQPEMPFLFAQLSSLNRPSWPKFRDSQRRLAQTVPGTAMVVTSDKGDSLDVHPTDKRPVGERFARQALHRVYSMTGIVPEGPSPVKAELSAPGEVTLTFANGHGMHSSDGAPLRTFELARYDGRYSPATAEIVSDNIIKITSTNMSESQPRYVRYGWQPFTRANLVNADNLPATTFKLSVSEAPTSEPGIEAGVSAAFAGMASGRIIRAGGCNFPSNPMAPGAQKKFYSGIYALTPGDNGQAEATLIGHLPEPMAYGASATTPEGLVIIGGTSASEPLRQVAMITVSDDGEAVVTSLPSLPEAVDNMAACYAGGSVYVAGGNVGGKPSNELLCLDLGDLSKGWKTLASFPGNPRVQPVLAASTDAKGRPCLYLWGGFAGKGDGREATLNTDGLCYQLSGKGKWSAASAPVDKAGEEVSLGGGIAVTLPDGRVVAMGGVNKDVFLEELRNQAPDYLSHPVEWYRFNGRVMVFDPAAQTWTVAADDEATARAGAAAAVTPDAEILLIGGELKPRIRTTAVSAIRL